MVTNLTRLGAVVIAFDVMFSEPDRLNPDVAADTLRNLDEETRAKLRALPSNDQIFADAIRRSRVVLGETGLAQRRSRTRQDPSGDRARHAGRGCRSPSCSNFPACCATSPVLEEAAAGRGLLTIRPERDGIVRRVPMIMLAQGVTMPSLSFEMLRVVTGTDTIFIKSDQAGIKSVGVKGFQIPTDRQRPALGAFRAPRSLDLCLGRRRARWQRPARQDRRASWC